MELDYTKTTAKTFDAAVQGVQDEIAKVGMRVLYVHDVQKTLGEKGFEREPFQIIEFCSAKFANEFLNKDIRLGLCMPCKINVYVKNVPVSATAPACVPRTGRSAGKQTFISGMRPVILPRFFPNANLGTMPEEIDRIIQRIINNAVL